MHNRALWFNAPGTPAIKFGDDGVIYTGRKLFDNFGPIVHLRDLGPHYGKITLGCGSVDGHPSVAIECWHYLTEDDNLDSCARLDVLRPYYWDDDSGYKSCDAVCLRPILKVGETYYANQINVFKDKIVFGKYGGTLDYNQMTNIHAQNLYVKGNHLLSIADIKTNISTTNSMLSLFKPENSQIYSYNLKKTPTTESSTTSNGDGDLSFDSSETINLEEAEETTSYGFVIGEGYTVPTEVLAPDGKAINLYSMASINWKATQELYAALLDAQNRITELENQLNNAT